MADAFPPSDPEQVVCEEVEDDPEEAMEEEEEKAGEEEAELNVEQGATYSCRRADGTYLDAEVVKTRMNKRAKREEYMVRYIGLPRRQTEWVDKTRLVLVKTQQEEDDKEKGEEENKEDEENDQEISEIVETLQNEQPDKDEPEAKKTKVEVSEAPANTSILSTGDLDKELICMLCSKLYEDPVMVECGHNFCRVCADQAWADQDSFTCPDCKEELTEKRFTTNRVLANLVKKVSGAPVVPVKQEKAIPFKNCDDHDEQVKLYCKEDGALCCIICRDSTKHTNHHFLPIVEAVGGCRAQLADVVKPLEEALKKVEEMGDTCSEKIKRHKTEMVDYRLNIVSEFEQLYNFLEEHKEKLLDQLQDQGQSVLEEMENNLLRMAKNKVDIEEAIALANDKVNDGNPIYLLTDIKQFLAKVQEQRKLVLSSKDSHTESELCRATFKGPLQYITWKQMEAVVSPEKKLGEPGTVADGSGEEAAQVPNGGSGSGPRKFDDFSDLKDKGCKEVWIVGDGYIKACFQRAENGPFGKNMGIPDSVCHIHTLIYKKWAGLLGRLKKEAVTQKQPDILVLHVGNFELGRKNAVSICEVLLNYLTTLRKIFPNTALILSTILPRREWLGNAVEFERKKYNANLRRFVQQNQQQLLRHEKLEKLLFARFRAGGDSLLNMAECEQFMRSMRGAVIRNLRGQRNGPERQGNKKPQSEQHPGPSAGGPAGKRGPDQQKSPKRTSGAGRDVKTIWVVGNYYVFNAHSHAKQRPYGQNLGFDDWNVRWLTRATRWHRLLPEMQKAMNTQGKPSAIVIHLGSEDLEFSNYETLINEMRHCLSRLLNIFPHAKIILTPVLPKLEWLGTPLEERRHMFNTRLLNYAERHQLQLAPLDKLGHILLGRFRAGHGDSLLRFKENDIFISGIKIALIGVLGKDTGMPPKKFNQGRWKKSYAPQRT